MFRAREAQKRVTEKGTDGVQAVARAPVDLRGRSLAELVDFALTNRPSIVSSRLAVEDARLAMKTLAADAPLVSKTPWTAPKLSLSGGYSEVSESVTMDGPAENWRTFGDPTAGLSLELLLWDFGRNNAQIRAQSEKVLAAEMQLSVDGYTVFGEVAKAYFDFCEQDALFEVALTNEARYAVQCAYAEARHQAGEADRLDVLRARLDLSQARQTTVAVSNRVVTSGATLMHALGIDAERGTCESVIGAPDTGVDCVMRAFPATTSAVRDLYALARTNAPSMRVCRAQLRAASHDVDYAVADLLPKLSASASLNWTNPFWLWSWGVSGAQSLFQGFRKTTAVDRAVVALEKASVNVDEQEQTLSKNIELAVATRDNAVKALETATASVRSARENYDTVVRQWGIGDVSRVEMSEAAGQYSTALGDRVSAFYDGQRAEAALFALVGKNPRYSEGKEKVAE